MEIRRNPEIFFRIQAAPRAGVGAIQFLVDNFGRCATLRACED